MDSIPGRGTKIPQATQNGQKKDTYIKKKNPKHRADSQSAPTSSQLTLPVYSPSKALDHKSFAFSILSIRRDPSPFL